MDLPREPKGSNCFLRGGSVLEFLRKPIATCDFPGGSCPLHPCILITNEPRHVISNNVAF